MAKKVIPPNLDDAINAYIAGDSEFKVSGDFKICRSVLKRCLIERGVPRRGMSEAQTLRASQDSFAARAARCLAANAAARGRKHSEVERAKIAATRERTGSGASPLEDHLAALLAAKGFHLDRQVAVGRYNCDFASFPVAVEVFGGYFHFYGRHLTRLPVRLRYLFDRGWSVLIVMTGKLWPLTECAADEVVSFHDQVRADPAGGSQYRMIRGAGDVCAAGRFDGDEDAVVEALHDGLRLRRNRHQLPTR